MGVMTKRPNAAFSPSILHAILFERLSLLPGCHIKIAYSGGLDSHVLLHTLSRLRGDERFQLSAIHIDHGLQAPSADWAEHCRGVCARLDVPCHVERIRIERGRRQSLEAIARRERYACLRKHIGRHEILATAHHQDDQAETLLIMLLRGAGIHGLAAMPDIVPFGDGCLIRPLLAFPRRLLADYAGANGLGWIEDASNRDLRFTRNFIRQRVLPLLHERWPQAGRLISRSAGHCAEAISLLDEMAQTDLDACGTSMASPFAAIGEGLSMRSLQGLPDARARNLLRYWFRTRGHAMPHTRLVNEILYGLVRRRTMAGAAVIRWPTAELRRYRDTLFLTFPLAPVDPELALPWDLKTPLSIPSLGLRLVPRRAEGAGLHLGAIGSRPVSVRLRQGGEVCMLPGRGCHQKLKKLYQARGIPPWERERIPLIYVGDQLAAVAGLWVCEPFPAPAGAPGVSIRLETLETVPSGRRLGSLRGCGGGDGSREPAGRPD